MKQIWHVRHFWVKASWAFFVIAVFFMYRGDIEKGFIASVLGALAWFISYRARMKEVIGADANNEQESEPESDET